ncbi:MAG TPA: hypothetical protein VFS20_27860 [Longimicrobium sp.]|nr:hypothetical protein [Longimicrobium sp.]
MATVTLNVDELKVTTFETAGPVAWSEQVKTPYSPYCCTEDNSGCDTNVEAGCTDPDAGCWVTVQPTGDADVG